MVQAVYVHIPFCDKICYYCDFNKVFIKNQPVDKYLQMMAEEMKNTVERFQYRRMKTIYVGGGTPTSLNVKQLETLLVSIRSYFSFEDDCEFTFEANPSNIDVEKLALLKAFGVNRLSIGVQAFQQHLLEKIGRDHTEKDIYMIIEKAKKVGFENISIDLMFGLPSQTLEMFQESIQKAIELEIDHISAYSLQVEPKTIFYNKMRQGMLQLPSEEVEAEMFQLLIDRLINNDFIHYEISNFARKGKESKHNLTYWNNDEYYGIGAGAHSYVGGVRRRNVGPLKHYINQIDETGFPYVEEIHLSEREKMEEELFLGLRKRSGVSKSKFNQKFNRQIEEVYGEVIVDLIKKELIECNSEMIRLTDKGVFLGNEVFEAFLL